MSSTPTTPPAGWYKNPENESQWRWWDGSKWTDNTAPIQQPGDPAPPTADEAAPDQPAPPAQAAPVAEVATQPPAQAVAPTAAAQPAAPQDGGGFKRGLGKLFGVKSEEEKEALAEYQAILAEVSAGNADPASTPARLEAAQQKAGLRDKTARASRLSAMRAAIDRVLADDYLGEDEEVELNDAYLSLGLTQQDLETDLADTTVRVMIARTNAGRLEPVENPELMVKKDEEVYLETPAQLLKEVTVRQYQGGYGGVSFRVAKGVRFNTGGIRGRMVPVGTEIQVADEGILSISNKRTVFLGSKKTQESRHDKLVGMKVFEDAIVLQVSNRQNASSFHVAHPELVAATINAASQDEL